MKYFTSDISGKKYPENEKIQLALVRINILDFIKAEYPEIDETKYISLEELDEYRQKYIEASLKSELSNLSSLEEEVIEKIKNNDIISTYNEDYNDHLTAG